LLNFEANLQVYAEFVSFGRIEWISNPRSVAFYHPYVLAFDTKFIEVRHAETVSIKVYRNRLFAFVTNKYA
jgi:hypothetical protein